MKNKFYNARVLTKQTPLKSNERDVIVQWIYDIHVVEWYTTQLLHQSYNDTEVQDKIQEIYLMICEVSQEKWNELYKQGKYAISAYVTGIIHQQIVSDNSDVYKKYNRHKERFLIKDDLFWETYSDEY